MRAFEIYLFVLLLIVGPVAADAASSCPLRMTFVAVGEGDATILEAHGANPMLVDTGSPRGVSAVVQYLRSVHYQELSGVILTHPHLDHVGGLFTILTLFPRALLFHTDQRLGKQRIDGDVFRWYQETLRSHLPPPRVLRRGDRVTLGAAVLEVLWPLTGPLDNEWNKNSLVLRVTLGEFRALLMGDALRSTEVELLRREAELAAMVLKVGHHGSEYASSEQFLKAVAPKLSVVSVNDGNIRGYPSPATLERLRRIGQLRRTDQDGTIELCATPTGDFHIMETRR
ncbi:MAG: MBL fold metallo-hydrolase [Proteobacteria bacterium]|nr:MBL fold metallo-hydrolase [Pseudomonadota bacterium]